MSVDAVVEGTVQHVGDRVAIAVGFRRPAALLEMEEVSRAFGQRIDGLLGQDLLREFDRVTIDFRAGRIVLSRGVASSDEREGPTARDAR